MTPPLPAQPTPAPTRPILPASGPSPATVRPPARPPLPPTRSAVAPHAPTAQPAQASGAAFVFWGVAFALLVTVMGYLVFRYFVTTVGPNAALFGLIPMAVVGGVATFFSPCSFPLLPGYLSYYHSKQAETARQAKWWTLGLAGAAGVITFALVLGVAIAALGAAFAQGLSISAANPNPNTRAFRALLGGLLIVLGILALTRSSFKMRTFDRYAQATGLAKAELASARRNLFLYGFGYNAAGIGCAGPILVGVVLLGLSVGGTWWALLGFATFGIVMGLLMLLVSWLVRRPNSQLLASMRANTARIKSVAGTFQILVGFFLIAATVYSNWFVRTLFP